MTEPEEIHFTIDAQNKECTFVSFRANNNRFSDQNAPLLKYKLNGVVKTFKNPRKGMLRLNLDNFKENDALAQGDVVAWWTGPCLHDMIMGTMCAACGMSMIGTKFIEDKQSGRAQYVSNVHNVPKLVVSMDKAKELSDANQQQLLNHKKLILLVDLDQTVIHTTNKVPRPEESKQDIHSFNLCNVFYYTKIRPHAYKLLDNMSKLFELHVVTYGQRIYAEQIVRLLDPGKCYFASRILTRDELISANSKSVNLQALFPSGPQLVMMIDDRPDVWENSDALIWVKPYKYFTEVGDINALNTTREEGPLAYDEIKQTVETDENSVTAKTTKTSKEGSGTKLKSSDQAVLSPTNQSNETKDLNTDVVTDTDDILVNVERILTDVHQAFFKHYEATKQIKPAREFASELRKTVLKGEVIVFSGIVRLREDIRLHPLYECCVQFGAVVEEEITDQTTTLIAVKSQTEKCHAAKKRGIPIVTPRWIEECMTYWKKAEKDKFLLQITTEYDHTVGSGLSHMDRLTKNDLSAMQDEVDQELAGLTSSSDEDEDSPKKKQLKRWE